MNLCRSCGEDFSSVDAFDRHRVGVHDFTFHEGLRLDPPREDGRRCLDAVEMAEKGMSRNPKDQWQRDEAVDAARRRFQNTPVPLEGSPENDDEAEDDREAA